jgi:hypothetical protein
MKQKTGPAKTIIELTDTRFLFERGRRTRNFSLGLTVWLIMCSLLILFIYPFVVPSGPMLFEIARIVLALVLPIVAIRLFLPLAEICRLEIDLTTKRYRLLYGKNNNLSERTGLLTADAEGLTYHNEMTCLKWNTPWGELGFERDLLLKYPDLGLRLGLSVLSASERSTKRSVHQHRVLLRGSRPSSKELVRPSDERTPVLPRHPMPPHDKD